MSIQKARATKLLKQRPWHILAGVLLTRPPLLLPDLHPFEARVQQYQEMIEQHQYTRFPVNFFFKQGSIAEKRWRQQNPREPKKSGSGIFRNEGDGIQEWIIGGKSDEQILKARKNAPPETKVRNDTKENEEELTDEEKRDLEQYAAEESEFEDSITELPEEINFDLHRLEREPQRTLYCLVKKSLESHKRSGRSERGWTLIESEAPGVDPLTHEAEGLHEV
jgi:large subunit ribosomal protein L46